MSKYIITGVDGNFGGVVAKTVQKLLPKEDLLFTAPTENGLKKFANSEIKTAVANFNDVAGLTEVFSNADKVLLISMPFVGEKRRQAHKNVVDACVAGNVKQIVYTSLVNATDPMNPSIEKIGECQEVCVKRNCPFSIKLNLFSRKVILMYPQLVRIHDEFD